MGELAAKLKDVFVILIASTTPKIALKAPLPQPHSFHKNKTKQTQSDAGCEILIVPMPHLPPMEEEDVDGALFSLRHFEKCCRPRHTAATAVTEGVEVGGGARRTVGAGNATAAKLS